MANSSLFILCLSVITFIVRVNAVCLVLHCWCCQPAALRLDTEGRIKVMGEHQ